MTAPRPAVLLLLAFTLATPTLLSTEALAAGGYRKTKTTKKAETPMSRANDAIADERYETAIPLLEGVVEAEPQNADAWNLLAYSNRKLGRVDEARRFYDRALEIDPKHRRAHEYLGELHLQTGDLESARAQLETLKQLCRFTCSERRQLTRAIKEYEKARGIAN
ncbi:MAG: tetratricopeptide repeat protein [Myxococcota bacterium]|nr:tetratricopeptide repeat protein [Myxococcota bacterium]